MSHVKPLSLRLIWLFAVVCLSVAAAFSQDERQASVERAVQRFMAAYQKRDLDGTLSLWSKKSPDYELARENLRKAFAAYDKIEVKNLRLIKVVILDHRAETDVAFEMSALDAKTGRAAEGLGNMNRTMVMVKEEEEWKVWKEAASEEELATALVAAQTEEKRRTLLDERKELVNVGLEKALGFRAKGFAGQGRFAEAIAALGLALKVAEKLNDKRGVASLLHLSASIHFYEGDFARSVEENQRSLKVAEELGDQSMMADAVNSIGIAHAVQGDNAQALDYFQRSLKIKEQLGDKVGVASNLNNIGGIYATEGDFAQALEYYQRSLKLAGELEDKSRYAGTLNNIGQVYGSQGNYAQALDYFQRSLKLKEELDEKVGIARVLNNLGSILASQGKYAEAVEYLQRSLKIKEEIKDKVGIAETLHNIGALHHERGEYRQALEYNQKSLQLAEALGYKHLLAYILQNMGDNYLKLGEYSSALEFAERSAALAQGADLANIYWRARATVGNARLALGQYEPARRDLLEAISAIEKLRGQVAGGEENLSLFFADKVSPYYSMVNLLIAQNKPFEALTFAERAKGRVLLDVLSSGRSDVTKGMRADEVNLDRRLTAEMKMLSNQLSRLKQGDKPDEAQVAALTEKLAKARLEYESFQTNLYVLHPELKVQRGQTRPLTPDEASLLLDEQTALLEYAVSGDKVYLFVMTSGAGESLGSKANLTVHQLGVTALELNKLAESFRRRVAERDLTIKRPASQLYDLLIAPVEVRLRGIKKLCIVPDGPLWEMPFQALYHDEQGYLLERYAISYAPSLSVLREMNYRGAKLRAAALTSGDILPAGGPNRAKAEVALRPKLGLLAMGNPDLSGMTGAKAGRARASAPALALLPDAEREVKALGQLYGARHSKILIGEGAIEEAVKAEAGGYLILHFATHAILDDSNPMYSSIILSHAADEDGRLEAQEIMKLDLNAEMVVLSGCQTARGRVAAGEGMIGMSWALFVAGSPATVVTQWEVDAARSADLMIDFHRNLLHRRAGISKAEALRQAALKLLRGPYNHPAYWAGFILIGDEK